ncbi:MAG TPA: tripartite tricarboxylate transporter substrate binding protein [Burkholderiales bacterium]|nr:tripartite tricarboxylate transporter substrate binding protein [Burkholderiales bacterium]
MKRCAPAAFVALCLCIAASAQSYPARPLRLVVTVPPGGISDFTARIVGPRLAEVLGQPVVVDNRPGAGGNIASELVAKARPDGHTLLIVAPPTAINVTLYRSLPFDTRRDLAPVALVGSVPNVLVVGSKTPARTVAELIDYARRNPGKASFASNSIGTSLHLSAELLKHYGTFPAVHIPYRGLPAAVTALLAGEVDFMFDSLSTALPYIRAGRTRALAITSRTRNPALPEAPTMIESGFPDFEVSGWTGIVTTGGTASAVIARLEGELRKILSQPDVVEAFEKPGMTVTFAGARDFARFLDAEITRWAIAVRESGATAD